MKDYVYLAGPMEDAQYEDMVGWRKYATASLLTHDINCLDPTRRVSYHEELQGVLGAERRVMNVSRRIFKQDMKDIASSRVILADIRRSSGRGTGTSMELMFGHTEHKIMIMWGSKEDFPHPFIQSMATEIHYDLDEAIEAVKGYY